VPLSNFSNTPYTFGGISLHALKGLDEYKALSFNKKLEVINRYSQPIFSGVAQDVIRSQTTGNDVFELRKNYGSSIKKDTYSSNRVEKSSDSTISCDIKTKTTEGAINEISIFSNNPNIYLGSFLDVDTILNGSYAFYRLPAGTTREPMQISLNLLQASGSVSEMVTDVKQGNVQDAINRVLKRNSNYLDNASWSVNITNIETRVDAEFLFGIHSAASIPPEIMQAVSGVPIGVDLSQSIDFSSSLYVKKHYSLVSAILTGYSANVSIGNPTDLFKPDTSAIIEDALYVSSITYGRQIYILFESDKLDANLDFSYESLIKLGMETEFGDVGISSNEKAKAKAAFQQYKVKATVIVIGGKASDIKVTLNDFDDLLQHIETVMGRSSQYYKPLSFTLNFLKDGATAAIRRQTTSVYPDCRIIAKMYKATLVSIRASKISDFFNIDEEIYGIIKVSASYISRGMRKNQPALNNKDEVLFNRSVDNFISVTDREYSINKSLEYKVDIDAASTFRIEILVKLSDKVDWAEGGGGNVNYNLINKDINLADIGRGRDFILTTEEINNKNAELKIKFHIEPL
jgi:hypothetical protein